MRAFALAFVLAGSAAAACTAEPGAGSPGARGSSAVEAGGAPAETAAANAPGQKPALPGQTRAPAPAQPTDYHIQTVAAGLDHPWSIEPLADGRILVTEKPGRLRIVTADGRLLPPISGLPRVDARGQGGLLDVALAPDFATSGRLYWSYAEPREGGNGTAVATGVLREGAAALSDVRTIWRMQPTLDSTMHFGSRLVFARDGKLFITLGERSIAAGRAQAQDMNSHFGKVVRINADGTVPNDNPFVGRSGVRPDIWSSGHRNIQSAALDPATGELWEVEHGAKGGDELNRVEAGKNYGWPVIAYGVEYSGAPIGPGQTAGEGMEQPVYYWDPVIAPSGMDFYRGDLFPQWRGNILVGGLGGQRVSRLVMDGGRVVAEEWLPIGSRVRDVKVGPDGGVYLATDEENGRILKLVPGSPGS